MTNRRCAGMAIRHSAAALEIGQGQCLAHRVAKVQYFGLCEATQQESCTACLSGMAQPVECQTDYPNKSTWKSARVVSVTT